MRRAVGDGGATHGGDERERGGPLGRRARWATAGGTAALLLIGGSAWALADRGAGPPAAPVVARPSAASSGPSAAAAPHPGPPSATPSALLSPSATPAATARPAAPAHTGSPAVRSPSAKGGPTHRPDPHTVSPQPCGTTCGTPVRPVDGPDCVRSPQTGQILTCDPVRTGTPLPRSPDATSAR